MTVPGFGTSHDDGWHGDALPPPPRPPRKIGTRVASRFTRKRARSREVAPVTSDDGLPEIVYDEEALASWREHLLAHVGHNVQLVFKDGRVRDAELRDVRHLEDGIIGLLVAYWLDDREPDEHAPIEPVSSLDLTRIRIY